MTSEEIKTEVLEMGRKARAASHGLAKLSTDQKNSILLAMADGLVAAESAVLEANAKDIASAKENGLTAAMIDRRIRMEGVWVSTRREGEIADAVDSKAHRGEAEGDAR